jgi:hypothetical protein
MSDFKGTEGPYQFVPIEKWPFGFEVKAGEYTLVSQDSWGWASGQKTRADNEQALGFDADQKQKVIQAIARQNANGHLLAASWDLLTCLEELTAAVRGKGPRDGKTLARADAAIRKAKGQS